MPTATELLKRGRKDQIWVKYCGFLDLEMDEFMEIQERLLMEQVALIHNSEIGKEFIKQVPKSMDDFRDQVPITSYEDYEKHFDIQREDVLPQDAYLWAHTSGRSGKFKWIPYTKQAYLRLGERALAGMILAAARYKGDVRFDDKDTLVYNSPPSPYISGVTLKALAEHFDFNFVPPLDKTEDMEFNERILMGFETGLRTGIDVLGSLSVVLVKMGESFAEGANQTKFNTNLLHPKTMFRLLRGYIRSKIEGRGMLPKDLWTLKAIPTGGMDTSIYRDLITHYWGQTPHEQYGSTEEGAIATQAWNKKGMIFFPDAAFLEFIPEEEWAKWRIDSTYKPNTVLLSEVEPGKRYEIVITNLFGKPLIRYRMHDLIKFTALEDKETGIKLPQMEIVGRSAAFIDLAGFTGLIDEKLVWQAIVNTQIKFVDWSARKEVENRKPIINLYFEPVETADPEDVQFKVREHLRKLNPFYADYEDMIDSKALKVTILEPGSFQKYQQAKVAQGADLAHLKPPHMNASDENIQLLLGSFNSSK
ncbi:MAG: GH3 auxin-responsive promoter family protein [Anaerolineales bacterium]